jgi:hypothetical protein
VVTASLLDRGKLAHHRRYAAHTTRSSVAPTRVGEEGYFKTILSSTDSVTWLLALR